MANNVQSAFGLFGDFNAKLPIKVVHFFLVGVL